MDVNFDFSEFVVDFSFLEKKKPVGVSGLLRVKNDAEFLELCIDSCIDALDELIISYQKCDDDAPEIIEKKRLQYPDKIKVYFYEPLIMSHNLTKEEFEHVRSFPFDSVHLLCNYYNYTLSKVSYRFAVKIDADQIYFSAKLKKYCDAYRSNNCARIGIKEWTSYYWVSLCNRLCRILPLNILLSINNNFVSNYEKYTLKMMTKKKMMVNISGINLFYDQDEWSVPLGNNENGIRTPFNGAGDHLFFELGPDTYYIPWVYYDKRINRYFYYEAFQKNKKGRMLYGGFFWFHMDAIRRNKYKEHLERYKNKVIPISDFFNDKIVTSVNKNLLLKSMRFYYFLFFEYEKKRIPLDLLDFVKKKIGYI